jgi:hypothetical protein
MFLKLISNFLSTKNIGASVNHTINSFERYELHKFLNNIFPERSQNSNVIFVFSEIKVKLLDISNIERLTLPLIGFLC